LNSEKLKVGRRTIGSGDCVGLAEGDVVRSRLDDANSAAEKP